MKERPILFSAPMIRALLAGTKTQTRRIVAERCGPVFVPDANLAAWNNGARLLSGEPGPYGVPGDRLWVRETFAVSEADAGVKYRADGDAEGVWRWKPSIFMRREYSRLTLEITEVRVERLQDISGEDAHAEGIVQPRCGCESCQRSATMCPADASSHIEEYMHLWDGINGKRAPWASNPWVWVLTFRRCRQT